MATNTPSAGRSGTPANRTGRKALEGIKVLEWSQLVAGPYCAKLLADLGAEVIKVEKPELGDEARHRPPFVYDNPGLEQSLLFLYLNTNKLGVTLDITRPSGREQFLELVRWADILIEDNPPQVMEGLQLTYPYLKKLNPGLVMTSITPFGLTGPYRHYKAYPINTYLSGGLSYRSLTGVQMPLKSGGLFGEYTCGVVSAVGTLAALYQQRRTGLGQQVDLAKQEAIMSLVRVQVDLYPNQKIIQSRFDARRSPGGNFRCQDGYVAQVGLQSHEWQALFKLIGNSGIQRDDRSLDMSFLEQHRDAINQRIADWALNRTKKEIYHQGQALGCPIAPVMTSKDIVDSAQSKARQFFVEVTHPVAGRLKYPSAPYHFSVTPAAMERPAPLLGQHNQEVFPRRLPSGKPDSITAEPAGQTSPEQSKEGILHGLRVADFAWAWAGPYATELLAFLGAQVIKVESTKRIDPVRQGSFTTGQTFTGVDASTAFHELNLGKLGIKLNLSQPKAIELAKRLVSLSDVVVQNMRPGAMERLGLGYEALRQVKPDIIYLSSSARGTTGPEREYSGYASHFAALGGIAHITGMPDSEPARGGGEMDLLSGATAAYALLAALIHRHNTGEGQHIDLSFSEVVSVLLGEVLMDYLANGRVREARGNRDEFMAPHNSYRCSGEDKWVSIAVATDEEWQALCQVMGNPAWANEERFGTASARWQNQAELDRLIEQWTSNYSHYEITAVLQPVGVAAVPCFNSEELFHNPHLNQRQCWTEVVHPVLGKQMVLTPPWKLSATPARIGSAAPLIGQHSHYVFRELLGLTDAEIRLLEEEEVIC